MERTWIYILAAFAIGFLFGMVLETIIDNKTIREQAEELRKVKNLYIGCKNNLDVERELRKKAESKPAEVNILDRRDIQAGELFKKF